MKNSDLYTLLDGIKEVSYFKGVKFAYVIAKNKKMVEDELKMIEDSNKPNEKFIEFDQRRVSLCEQHSNKYDDGRPKILGDKYDIKDMDAFNKDLESLKNEYALFIVEREQQVKEYAKLLDDECKLTLAKLNSIYLPNDINANQIDKIIFMIED